MARPSLSVCIITYNEESCIRQCLRSVEWAEEIVVVDSFSTDKTVEICKEYTDRVYQRPFPGHVEQKNYALGLASHAWALCLDADECLSPELIREVQETLCQDDGTYSGYYLPRHTFYLGRWINHSGWYPDYKLRLFRRGMGKWGGINPHDKVILQAGATSRLKGELWHFNYKDLSDHLRTVDNFSAIFVKNATKDGARFHLPALFFRPLGKFLEVYLLKRGFLDGVPGFILAVVNSFYIFLKYAKWWETERKDKEEV